MNDYVAKHLVMADSESKAAGSTWWDRLHYWEGKNLSREFIITARDGTVVDITQGFGLGEAPPTAECATHEGSHMSGSSKMKSLVEKTYGKPESKSKLINLEFWLYDAQGVHFIVNREGQLLSLEIFVPRSYCAIQKGLQAAGFRGAGCQGYSPPPHE